MMDLYNVKIEDLLPIEQLEEYKAELKRNDNNINGFSLPIPLKRDSEYRDKLKDVLSAYQNYVSEKEAFKTDEQLLQVISNTINHILCAIEEYLCGDIFSAQRHIYKIIKPYCDDSDEQFVVSELDNSYAFRGIAPIKSIGDTIPIDAPVLSKEVSFFRARKSTGMLSCRGDMSYIPLEKRECVSTERFSIAGVPCLYLATTSYCCWLELNRPSRNEFYCSSFKVNERGKKLKILNLAISEGLINGIFNRALDRTGSVQEKLQRKLMMIFPLVIATSFSVQQENRNFKSEYIISQLVMQCLHKLSIDGIAYTSKKSYSDYEFPHNVNLAIPIYNGNSHDINKCFSLSMPVSLDVYSMLDHNLEKEFSKSYVNEVFNEGFTSNINYGNGNISYKSILFAMFDNYLVHQTQEILGI